MKKLLKFFVIISCLAAGMYAYLNLLTNLSAGNNSHTAKSHQHNSHQGIVRSWFFLSHREVANETKTNLEKKRNDSVNSEREKIAEVRPTKLTTKPADMKKHQKYLIFVCDNRRSCGGWGDRQRGLVGAYALALATERKFGVVMTKPCNLTEFYLPSDVNWIIPNSELKGKTNITLDDMDSRLKLTGRLQTMDFNKEYPQDVIYVRSNAEYWLGLRLSTRYIKKLPNWAATTRAQYFAAGWKKLMKPSPSLQKHLDTFMKRIDFTHRKFHLVCSHVRVGRSETIKMDSAQRFNVSELPILWDFMDTWVKNGSRVFFATDSWQARNLTRKRFGDKLFDTGGEIIHVDKQAGIPNACRGFESALLDQLILTYCDVLIMSNSIFGQRASYVRGKAEDLYSFFKGKVRKANL